MIRPYNRFKWPQKTSWSTKRVCVRGGWNHLRIFNNNKSHSRCEKIVSPRFLIMTIIECFFSSLCTLVVFILIFFFREEMNSKIKYFVWVGFVLKNSSRKIFVCNNNNKFLKLIIKNKTCKNTRQKTILEGRYNPIIVLKVTFDFLFKNKLLDSYTLTLGGACFY